MGELTKTTIKDFSAFLEKGRQQLAMALPRHLTPDRMIRLACTEFSKNPTLQKCERTSVFGAIITAAQLGLEIGVNGQAWLVPFWDTNAKCYKAQLIPGYQGLMDLARRSGEITSIQVHLVYEKDEFDLSLGLVTEIKHKPFLNGDRGEIRLVYGVAQFRDGGMHFDWMSIEEVNKIRDGGVAVKAAKKFKSSTPWDNHYSEMVRKTMVRRLTKYLPKSIELSNAIQLSEAAESGKFAHLEGDFVVVDDDSEPGQKEPEMYSDADFEKNAPKWMAAIDAGKKTAAQIIAALENTWKLTEEQKAKIIAIEKPPMPEDNDSDLSDFYAEGGENENN